MSEYFETQIDTDANYLKLCTRCHDPMPPEAASCVYFTTVKDYGFYSVDFFLCPTCAHKALRFLEGHKDE